MNQDNFNSPRLRVITGGQEREMAHGRPRIVASAPETPPFDVDAVVLEEDRFLVMSAEKTVTPVDEPMLKVMSRVIDTQPEEMGTIVDWGGSPRRLLAVVHDLDQTPTFREAWIEKALEQVWAYVEARQISALGMQLLGTVFGRLPPRRFATLLFWQLEKTRFDHLRRLWLMAPAEVSRDVVDILQGYCYKDNER